jgi:hypothetical protein
MGRHVDTELLVGAAEIAKRLGVSRAQTVHNWRTRDLGFPEPVATLEVALVFYWPDVESWARETGRLSVDQ